MSTNRASLIGQWTRWRWWTETVISAGGHSSMKSMCSLQPTAWLGKNFFPLLLLRFIDSLLGPLLSCHVHENMTSIPLFRCKGCHYFLSAWPGVTFVISKCGWESTTSGNLFWIFEPHCLPRLSWYWSRSTFHGQHVERRVKRVIRHKDFSYSTLVLPQCQTSVSLSLLAPQSGALSRIAFRDLLPILIQSHLL